MEKQDLEAWLDEIYEEEKEEEIPVPNHPILCSFSDQIVYLSTNKNIPVLCPNCQAIRTIIKWAPDHFTYPRHDMTLMLPRKRFQYYKFKGMLDGGWCLVTGNTEHPLEYSEKTAHKGSYIHLDFEKGMLPAGSKYDHAIEKFLEKENDH